VNATGILLHTGLGRAPLCEDALAALQGLGRYSLLQADVATGGRSLREEKIERLLVELTGCEAATVVNNNAAATMLVLNTLAAGREVVVSRGQLVEIGGSFRMPDVMARSGAVMREVGTTNRTRLSDYEAAVGERTGAILHVHTSNYRIRGFSWTPPVGELVELARRLAASRAPAAPVPVIDDLGSGALVRLSEFGIEDEPLVRDSIAAGVAVACMSGDKLISGPQAGIAVGRREVIEAARSNPLARAFRVCKMTLAALEATLVHFVNGTWREAIPFYRLLARSLEELDACAAEAAGALSHVKGVTCEVLDDVSYVGSGAAPDQGIATRVVAVRSAHVGADELARRLRTGVPSIFARVRDDAVLFDMRTVMPEETDALRGGVVSALGGPA
jgi:L-seryl-tRNA(Ser) seleniumtransferase